MPNDISKSKGSRLYYHYCKNLYKKAKKFGLMKSALIDETKKILEIFYKIPFIIQKINIFEYLNKIYDKY